MRPLDPGEVLRLILGKVAGVNWQSDGERLEQELFDYLTEDLLSGPYELVGVSSSATLRVEGESADTVEFFVSGTGLPQKALMKLGSDGNWRLSSFWGQCTGCLGSGEILETVCTSCGGTGWGLRPI